MDWVDFKLKKKTSLHLIKKVILGNFFFLIPKHTCKCIVMDVCVCILHLKTKIAWFHLNITFHF